MHNNIQFRFFSHHLYLRIVSLSNIEIRDSRETLHKKKVFLIEYIVIFGILKYYIYYQMFIILSLPTLSDANFLYRQTYFKGLPIVFF